MTIASGGAGNITLGTAVDGYQTFADAGVSDADTLRYTIEDGDDWEIGTGVYTASGTTLVRTVTESSNSDAALNCSGDAIIFVTLAAEDFSGNAAPLFTNPLPAGITLEKDGTTANVLDGRALDDNGFPITYSWDGSNGTTYYDDDNLPPQLQSAPTINQATGAVSVIGSSDILDAGTFTLRIKASDGVRTAAMSTAAKLSFLYETGMVAYYDAGDPASYSGSGSTWSDLSGNGYHLTLATDGSMVYNSSGTGSKPSFSLGKATGGGSAFEHFSSTHAYSATDPVYFIAILRHAWSDFSTDGTGYGGFIGRPSGGYPAIKFVDSTYATNRGDFGLNTGAGNDTTSVANVNPFGTQTYSEVWVDGAQLPKSLANLIPYGEDYQIAMELTTGSGTTNVGNYTVDSTKQAQYHSFMINNMRLDTGIRAAHSTTEPPYGIELRAMLIYDHEPSDANKIAIHNVFKGIYGSDMASAP
jgi:hypothetical protein